MEIVSRTVLPCTANATGFALPGLARAPMAKPSQGAIVSPLTWPIPRSTTDPPVHSVSRADPKIRYFLNNYTVHPNRKAELTGERVAVIVVIYIECLSASHNLNF